MHIIIGVVLTFLLRVGLQWIFGKGWGLFLSVLWLSGFLFFGLCTLAPPFPFGAFKGASATGATFSVLGIIFGPFILAKIAIQGSTQNSAKAWLGGFLFCLMSTSIIVVWLLMSALDSNNYRQNESRYGGVNGFIAQIEKP